VRLQCPERQLDLRGSYPLSIAVLATQTSFTLWAAMTMLFAAEFAMQTTHSRPEVGVRSILRLPCASLR
jgi:hypothetical protein